MGDTRDLVVLVLKCFYDHGLMIYGVDLLALPMKKRIINEMCDIRFIVKFQIIEYIHSTDIKSSAQIGGHVAIV